MQRDVTTGTTAVGRYQGMGAAGVGRFRLTRRGRLVKRCLGWCGVTTTAAVVIMSLVLGISAVIAPGAQAGDGSAGVSSHETVTVAPGESLWSLAVQHQPGRDPRQVVADIERLNGLPAGSLLQVGTQLQVPSS